MRHVTHLVLIAAVGANLSACATVFHGTTQEIVINSTPSGAPVVIDGVKVGNTPIAPTLERRSHTVAVGGGNTEKVEYKLEMRPSAWLLLDLLMWPTLIVDIASGSAGTISPGQIHSYLTVRSVAVNDATLVDSATAKVAAAPPPPPPSYLGMRPGQRLRFDAADSDFPTEAFLDSITGDRVYLRTVWGDFTAASSSIVISETRHLQVWRGAQHLANAGSLVHSSSQVAWAAPLVALSQIGSQERGFRAGAAAAAVVIPASFIVGAALAPDRWAPLEAQRSGSPLLVDDRLRVRHLGASGVVSGKLVDMDATHLVLRDGSTTHRIQRSSVVSVDRADGYDWRARAIYGVALGAMMGFLNVSNCACSPTRKQTLIVPATSALIGLLAAPALAPRRWRPVDSW